MTEKTTPEAEPVAWQASNRGLIWRVLQNGTLRRDDILETSINLPDAQKSYGPLTPLYAHPADAAPSVEQIARMLYLHSLHVPEAPTTLLPSCTAPDCEWSTSLTGLVDRRDAYYAHVAEVIHALYGTPGDAGAGGNGVSWEDRAGKNEALWREAEARAETAEQRTRALEVSLERSAEHTTRLRERINQLEADLRSAADDMSFHVERADKAEARPGMPVEVDDLIEEYADVCQGIYDKRTAGDYTFQGFLATFFTELRARAEEEAQKREEAGDE